MNPLKWFGKFFCPVGSGRRNFKYSRNVDERLCTDSPGTPEWNRFWDSWEETKTKYLNTNSKTHNGNGPNEVNNFKGVNLKKPISKNKKTKTNSISSPLFSRIFSRQTTKRKMKLKIVNLENTNCVDDHVLDVTKIRANGYKIKSCGFPISACTTKGSMMIRVEVGSQPNGLLTTRINTSAQTIHMEVVGVEDHLIQKSLVIKGKTSAQVIDLTSPVSDQDGFILFKIP